MPDGTRIGIYSLAGDYIDYCLLLLANNLVYLVTNRSEYRCLHYSTIFPGPASRYRGSHR